MVGFLTPEENNEFFGLNQKQWHNMLKAEAEEEQWEWIQYWVKPSYIENFQNIY
jgi:hypothetical protein